MCRCRFNLESADEDQTRAAIRSLGHCIATMPDNILTRIWTGAITVSVARAGASVDYDAVERLTDVKVPH